MSATPSPAQPAVIAPVVSAIPDADINASCRVPLMLLFLSATGWLFAGSVFAIIASLKFHMPSLLADCAWFTYGRVHAAQFSAFIYGFGIQAGLGVALWVLAQSGRAKLALAPTVIAGWLLLNLGVTVGFIGILYGESTGHEWLEMPRYGSVMVFFGYVMIALAGVITLHERTVREFYVSQWFLLAALFWFPWIYSTANFTLVLHPMRGTLQAAIDWWYIKNLTTIWFGFVGLAALFYFIPKIIRRPFQGNFLGLFIFATLLMFGSWGGIPTGTPLPSWMPAMSTLGALLTVAPIIAVCMSMKRTFACDFSQLKEERTLKFFFFGGNAYVIGGLAAALNSLMWVNKITNFTWALPAGTQWVLYGFFAMTMFGAIYHIVPRLTGTPFPKPNLICLHFMLAWVGLILYVVPLIIGGIKQGMALNDSTQPFVEVMNGWLLFFRISTMGDLLMFVGNLLLAVNLLGLVARAGCTVATVLWTENSKRVEVIS